MSVPDSWIPIRETLLRAIPDFRERDKLIVAFWNDLNTQLAACQARWKWLEENLSCDYKMDDEGLPDVAKYEFTWVGTVSTTAGPHEFGKLVDAEIEAALAKAQTPGA